MHQYRNLCVHLSGLIGKYSDLCWTAARPYGYGLGDMWSPFAGSYHLDNIRREFISRSRLTCRFIQNKSDVAAAYSELKKLLNHPVAIELELKTKLPKGNTVENKLSVEDLEDFHFDGGMEQNFLAYLRMRYIGAALTKENFFEKVFYKGEIGNPVADEMQLLMLHNLHFCKPYRADSMFNRGRNYDTIISEIQQAFEYFYGKWIDAHSRFEERLRLTLLEVEENGGNKMFSPYWNVSDIDHTQKRYGEHFGVLVNIADQHYVVPKVRAQLLKQDLPPSLRAPIIMCPGEKFSFATARTVF